jgi:hypothetical protein
MWIQIRFEGWIMNLKTLVLLNSKNQELLLSHEYIEIFQNDMETIM